MHVIEINPQADMALKLAMILHELNTELVSLALDVSGSTPMPLLRKALDSVVDALSITMPDDGNVNIIQFDDGINYARSVPKNHLVEHVADMDYRGGGGGNFLPVLSVFNTGTTEGRVHKNVDLNRIILRQHRLANTPIILLSDGMLGDTRDTDLEPVMFGKMHPHKARDPYGNNFIAMKWAVTETT